MSELVFREIRGDVVRRHGNCPPVVDLFFNEPLLAELAAGQRKDPPHESCLLHIRWENDDVFKDVYSAISVQPRLSFSDFNGRLAMHLDAGGSVVCDFISAMHHRFHAQLVQVMLDPASFIFQHEDKDALKEMEKQRKILSQTFKALLSDIPNCQTKITIRPAKKPVESAPRWQCFTSSNTASQSSTGDKTTAGRAEVGNRTRPSIEPTCTLDEMKEGKKQPFNSMTTETSVCKRQLQEIHHQIEHQRNSNEMANEGPVTLVGDTVTKEHTVQYRGGNKNKQGKMFSSSSDKNIVFSGHLDAVQGGNEDNKADKIPKVTKTSVVEEQFHKSQQSSSVVSDTDKTTKDVCGYLGTVETKELILTVDLSKNFQTESSHCRYLSPENPLPEEGKSVRGASQEKAFCDKDSLMLGDSSARDISRKPSNQAIGPLSDWKNNESSGWNSGIYTSKTKLQGHRKSKLGAEGQNTRYDSESSAMSQNDSPRIPQGSSSYGQTPIMGYESQLSGEFYCWKITWTKPDFYKNILHFGLHSPTMIIHRMLSSRAKEVKCTKQDPRHRHNDIEKPANQYSELRKQVTSIPVSVVKESTCENPRGYGTQMNQLKEIVINGLGDIWSKVDEISTKDLPNAPRDKSGTDTVLCLDLSDLTHSDDVRQLKFIVLKFLDGVEDLADTHGLEENICIVTVGGNSKILHPFSNDYHSLRNAVGTIDVCAFNLWDNSLVTLISALSKGDRCEMGECILVPPRFIIVTRGVHIEYQTFVHQPQGAHLFFIWLFYLGDRLVKNRLLGSIIFVPFGDSSLRNVTSMKPVIQMCNGQVVNDISMTCKHQQLHRVSAQICLYIVEEYIPLDFSFEIAELIIAEVCSDFSSEDLHMVVDAVQGCLYERLGQFFNTKSFDNFVKNDWLPRIGTRVIRGPDWQWGDQGCEGAGTIINHGRYHGTLWVLWDNGHCNAYRYGLHEFYDVLITDDRPRISDVEGEIYIGMQVERGPNWQINHGNQDGGPGSLGTVIRKQGKCVLVLWPNDHALTYTFGAFGRFEVCIRDLRDLLPRSVETSFIDNNLADEPPVPPESLGPYVWQWFDASVSQWTPYSEGNDAKLKSSYQKRPDGSCLVHRNGHSFRVSFKTLHEKEIEGDNVTKVRRKSI